MVRERTILLAALALLLAGCASTPESLRGGFTDLQPANAGQADIGDRVRWGGRLLEVRPRSDRTCFEILSRGLDDIARPVDSSNRPGRRFLACRDGFDDPAAYPEDADITVIGELTGFEVRTIGEYDYRYPVLRLEAAHVWPQRRVADPAPMPPPRWWYDPYWRYYPYP